MDKGTDEMGTVYKETFTKPLPPDAELFTHKGERWARWRDSKGRLRKARVTTPTTGSNAGVPRLLIESAYYTAKFRDGSGLVRKVSTGCRDEAAARSVLTELERRAELVKAKVMTSAEDAIADHQSTPLSEHIAAYLEHLRAKGVTRPRIETTRGRLERIANHCRFGRLSDLSGASLER